MNGSSLETSRREKKKWAWLGEKPLATLPSKMASTRLINPVTTTRNEDVIKRQRLRDHREKKKGARIYLQQSQRRSSS